MGPLEFIKKIFDKISIKKIFAYFGKSMLNTFMGRIENSYIVRGVKNAVNKFKKVKAIFKIIIKVLSKILSFIVKLLTNWITLAIIACIILLFVLMTYWNTIVEALGGFRGTIEVDIGKMQELNQDVSMYIDLQNTSGLLEAFYQDVSSSSYYQTFNLRDMDTDSIDVFTKFLINATNFFKADGSPDITAEDIFAQRKVIGEGENTAYVYGDNNLLGFGSFISAVQYDPRYIYTDANKNPVKYLKQAELLGTDETRTQLNAYFRDYYNRESIFTLSPTLLYDLNQWAYGSSYEEEQIVYPEAFVKPIHFVNDFRRIQNDKDSENFGEEYVYVTQRVSLDDIRDSTSEFYNQYQHEGLIYSTPSNIVWDYAITESNIHQIEFEGESSSAVNIGNVASFAVENFIIEYGDSRIGEETEFIPSGSGGTIINGENKILGFGDSYMAGIVAASKGTIVNAAVSGESIKSISNRANQYSGFDIVLISAGANDWGRESIVDSYKELIDKVVAGNPNATIIISKIPYVLDDKSTTLKNSIVEKFNREIETQILPYARSKYTANDFLIYDTYTMVKNNINYKSSDGIHLTSTGYNAWLNGLKTLGNIDLTQYESNTNNLSGVVSTNNDFATRLVKLYWKVSDDCMDRHMGEYVDESEDCLPDESSTACFIGPYLTMEVVGDNIVLSNLITDSVVYANNNIDRELNKCPRKHLQTAPIFDEEGNMLTSSRNLFNKVYVRQKTVKPSYRNSDEYWLKFEDFIEEDLSRGTSYTPANSALDAPCTVGAINTERALTWENRQCSVIRVFVSNGTSEWIIAKLKELTAFVTSGDVSNATMNVSPEAIYRILMEYEDYLIATGMEGREWQYKYFATSDSDRLEGILEFTHFNLGFFSIPDWRGIKDILYKNSDKITYQNTFNAYVESNNNRTIASEYVPVAIVSGNKSYDANGQYVGNSLGWGWKYDISTNQIRMVLGEASLEFPDYYTSSDGASAISNSSSLTSTEKAIIGLFLDKNKKYGDVTYGASNFTRYWQNGNLVDAQEWESIRDKLIDRGILTTIDVSYVSTGGETEVDKFGDFRNDEYVWNPDTIIYRPKSQTAQSAAGLPTATMQKCTNVGSEKCGRITTQSSADDYLPMEIKSVRDYGLGSVLSYIEGRKVVFKTGIGVSEDYNVEGVKEYFDDLNRYLGTYGFKDGLTGFYPMELLDSTQTVKDSSGSETTKSLITIYRTFPEGLSLEDLTSVAHSFLSLQGTGNKVASLPDGRMCKLSDRGDVKKDMNGSQYVVLCTTLVDSAGKPCEDGKDSNGNICKSQVNASGNPVYVESGMYAFVPHITDSSLVVAFKSIFDTGSINNTNQFWDPMAYYLAWFDYLQEFDSDDIWSKKANLITNGFSKELDNSVAAALRALELSGGNSFAGISDLSPWITKLKENPAFYEQVNAIFYAFFNVNLETTGFWGEAGSFVSEANKEKFFNQYSNDIKTINLIDDGQTQKLYLIEEAATFLGEFIYTYKDTMSTIGSMVTENAQVSDIVWANRYYYLSNYIFSQNVAVYKYKISSVGTTGMRCSRPSDTYKSVSYSFGDLLKDILGGKTERIIADGRIYGSSVDSDSCACSRPCQSCSTGADGQQVCTPSTCCATGHSYEYVDVTNYIDYQADKTLNLDAPAEIINLSNKLINAGYSETAEKLWINTKIYADLNRLGWFDKNSTNLNESFIHDYSDDSSVGYPDEPTYEGDIGDNEDHYDVYDRTFLGLDVGNDVKSTVSQRTGLKVDVDNSIPKILDLKNELINDIDYKLDLINGSNITPQDFVKLNSDSKILKDNDLNNIAKVIYDEYGDNPAFKTETVSVATGMVGYNVSVKTGQELSNSAKDMLVGINLADRTDEGYPLPLFEHIAGDIKEIVPLETGAFFNGETLNQYKTRIAFKDDDEQRRYDYLISERENRTSYLYDYLTNFEAYVPLDVKSDGDLQIRGYDSLISIRVNKNSYVENTSSYTSVISGSVDSEAWASVLSKFSNTSIDKQAMSQLLAGIVEVSIKEAPKRTIALYNQQLSNSGQVLISNNASNLAKIENVIKKSILLNGNMPDSSTLDDYRTVELEMEDNSTKKFYLPILGYGAIEAFNPLLTESYNGTLNTSNYGMSTQSIKDITLNINSGIDERLDMEKSIDYVSTKFARLYNKYGNASYALMAYFFGEDYWNALVDILSRKGTSTVNWANATEDDIVAALNLVYNKLGLGVTISEVNMDVYNHQMVSDVLSYVSDAGKRTDLIQSSAVGSIVDSSSLGENASVAEAIYAKWNYLIDMYSTKYNVDPALVAAIWAVESRGEAFAGICSNDNIETACGGVYTPACKTSLKCEANSNYLKNYNGGGGLGQVHDTRGTGGTGSGAGKGGGGGWSRCTQDGVCVTIYNPREEGASYNIGQNKASVNFNMQGYMKADTRFDPDISAEWSISYISLLLKEYDGDVMKAVVSYNRGSVYSLIKNAKSAGYGDDWHGYYLSINDNQSYWLKVSKYYSNAISNGTLTLSSGGMAFSNIAAYENTGAYNSYTRDKLGLQNTGIQVMGSAGTLSRSDVDMILASATKTEESVVHAYEYDIFNFFNKEVGWDIEAGSNGDWLMSSNIAQLGTYRNLNEVERNVFSGLPPLFRINAPFGPDRTYKITSRFGYRTSPTAGASSSHKGIDFGIERGVPIYPIAPGKIETMTKHNTGSGFGVYTSVTHSVSEVLDIANGGDIVQTASGKYYKIVGIRSYYAHMVEQSNSHLSIGQQVGINDMIGTVNSTGSSTGNHLHFEIRLKAQELDANGNVVSTTDWISVDPEIWMTTLWYDESGNLLPAYNIVFK